MKKTIIICFMLIAFLYTPFTAVYADAKPDDMNLSDMFDSHGAVMLIIEPQTGAIVYANKTEILEENEIRITVGIIIASGGIIVLLLLFLILMEKSQKRLISSNQQIENFNELRQTFIDTDESIVYLKDENLKYLFVNRAFELFYNKKSEEIIGYDDFALGNDEFAQKRRETDLAVFEKETLVTDEVKWNGRIYKTTKFPVRMLNGKFGVGANIRDITEEHEKLINTEMVLYRHKILVDVLNRSFQSRQEQLDYVLHRALELTESRYGYIYMYNEDKQEFILNSWTKDVMEACKITDKSGVYQLDKTGIWGEVVRQRKPIIVNNFEMDNPLKKGYPNGHVELKRFMSIPVIIDEKIVAVAGLANKAADYDENNIYEMTLLMNGVWNSVERREKQEILTFERNKYLQTLVSIGDGVLVVGMNGNIEMLNPAAENLTGWSLAEAYGMHYRDVFVISHEREGFIIGDPIEKVLASDNIQKLENHAVLTSRNGTKYYLEDSAAPIKNEAGNTVGVILVFRNVTDKKEQTKKIEYLSFHDSLTGLYNRRFFEEELHRLNTDRNLPVSIIMGDVNGLKLTNDIFGHSSGDELLKTIAKVFCKVCRSDEIIARWGGDEFVILLPNTNLSSAEKIITRIKEEFAKEQIKSIRGSISIGADTKHDAAQNIWFVLDKAEEKMYVNKAMERDKFRSGVIESIIKTLHENSPREKEHSVRVGKLCGNMGKLLKFTDTDIKKSKDAGYLHDIGKIVLEPKLLEKLHNITDKEWNEIKKHPVIGYRILNSFDQTLNIAEIVFAHQERWDGTGYPKGLKGDEIPIISRIIAIAESYERRFSEAAGDEHDKMIKATENIRKGAGTHFDPALTEIFIKMIENERAYVEQTKAGQK